MAPTNDDPAQDEVEHRFELRRMLQEIEVEIRAGAKPPGHVRQSDILEMINSRKTRDSQRGE